MPCVRAQVVPVVLDVCASLPPGLTSLALGGVLLGATDMLHLATHLTRLTALQVRCCSR